MSKGHDWNGPDNRYWVEAINRWFADFNAGRNEHLRKERLDILSTWIKDPRTPANIKDAAKGIIYGRRNHA